MSGYGSNRLRYAARLSAFKASVTNGCRSEVESMIAAATRVDGLSAADLNFPNHFSRHDAQEMSLILNDHGLVLNGIAMRYYTDPGFAIGAFTNPDPSVRRKAIDLTKDGIDAAARMGGSLMTLWMGQDGFDYSFQVDYAEFWSQSIDALTELADHNPAIDLAIEYKPIEPRAFALMPDVATTLLAIGEVNRPNVGVTLDFAHVLYADEIPAHAVHLVSRNSRLLGVYLNDGYGKRDDGLMVGTVHPIQTVEMFVELANVGYGGMIYLDTFPDHSGLDPVEECRTNIANAEHLWSLAGGLKGNAELQAAIRRQDATVSQRIVSEALYGLD